MADQKITPLQAEQVQRIQDFQKSLARIKKLVGELESNRAARPQVLQDLGSQIAREFSRLRARAVGASIGTVADLAGQLSVAASRSSGLLMKLRTLHDGVASLTFQLDRALTAATTPEPKHPA
jgi:hypothetical protein